MSPKLPVHPLSSLGSTSNTTIDANHLYDFIIVRPTASLPVASPPVAG